MIYYNTRGLNFWLNLFRWRGSAFHKALRFALPCAVCTGLFRWCLNSNYLTVKEQGLDQIIRNNVVWTGVTVLVGFLVIFRTSQAYNRFLEGAATAHKMRVEWFDACTCLIAFTSHTKTDSKGVAAFNGLLVRLFSMLHAAALADIEGLGESAMLEDHNAFEFDLLDVEAVDKISLETIRVSDTKPELLFFWINKLAVEGMASGILTIPPPILSRFFQNLSTGMVWFHEAVKLSSVPFPFPYAQTCDWLLLMHCFFTPLIVAQWVSAVGWSAAFAFLQVFIVWSLNGIAQEIENPFGKDANDLELRGMQEEMNQFLLMLVSPAAQRLPSLVAQDAAGNRVEQIMPSRKSFNAVWRNSCPSPEDYDFEAAHSERSCGSANLSEALTSKPTMKRFRTRNQLGEGFALQKSVPRKVKERDDKRRAGDSIPSSSGSANEVSENSRTQGRGRIKWGLPNAQTKDHIAISVEPLALVSGKTAVGQDYSTTNPSSRGNAEAQTQNDELGIVDKPAHILQF